MDFSKIDDLPVSPDLISKLKKANLLSLKKILNFSSVELQHIAKLTQSEASIVFKAASVARLESNELNVWEMFNDQRLQNKLQFQCFKDMEEFDGIYPGTITEICGESGSGKTQMCLQLSLWAQISEDLGGLSSRVLYICSEGEFPIKRLMEMAVHFKSNVPSCKDLNLTDNLVVKPVHNLAETMHVLQNGIPILLKNQPPIKVIIIDSVAALLRCEYDSLDMRNLMIHQLTSELWKLAHVNRMLVLCVNQISGVVQKFPKSSISTDAPSLGLLWSNILTSRFKISRNFTHSNIVVRTFEIIYSSYHPRTAIDFYISEKGVEAYKR